MKFETDPFLSVLYGSFPYSRVRKLWSAAACVFFTFLCLQTTAQAAVAFAAAGAVATGTTAPSVPHPAGIVAGDLLVLVVGNKYPTNGPSTPAGWTLVANGQQSGGLGAAGNDSGQVYATIFVKVAVGGESGNLAVTITSANTSMGRMFRYTKAAGTSWDYAATNGSDNTAGTAWSVTGAANSGITAGDMVVVGSATNGNVVTAWASQSVSATGATFGTHTERQDSSSGTGNDMSLVVSDHTVTAGTATAAPVFTMTGTGTPSANSPTGASIFLRIRETTTTLATGSDPAPATIAPGAVATDVNLFTLQTNSGTETVSSVTVNLSTSTGVDRLAITNNAGAELGFTTTPATGSNTISVAGMSATTTLANFRVRITPLSHATMPVVPGANYAITAPVTAWVGGGTHTHVGSDTNTNALTIDNLSPNGATATSSTAGTRANTLNWTSSNSTDFATTSGSVVYRWAAASVGSEVPAEGSTPTLGATNGTATVACVTSSAASTAQSRTDGTGGSADCTTTALTAGQDYSYVVFQKDSNGNYDQGVSLGTVRPTGTITLADGGNPGNSTLAPGAAITDLDAFTFATDSGANNVTALTVTLTGVNSFQGLSEVRITSNDGATTYFAAVANPASNTVSFSGGTPLPVSSSTTSFKVRITPKTHTNMPAPPGATYTVGGTVTAFTSTYAQTGTDGASATVTIDNLSPNGATVTSGTAGNQKNTLNWTSSNSADFATTNGSVLYRWAAASAGTEVPAEGSSPTLGATNGTATVACLVSSAVSTALVRIDGAGGSADCNTTSLTAGQAYSYKVFQRDSNGNFDLGVAIGTFTPVGTTILADGTNPGNVTLAPGASITDLDAFTLTTSSGTDNVTALTVTLTGVNSFQGLSEVRITSSDGATTYFAAVANPASNTVSFSGGTPLPVSSSTTSFNVRITPKTHANMPAPPGATYTVGGTVTAFTSTYAQTGTDGASATVTIDNLSPNSATATSGTVGNQKNTLNWTSSNSTDFVTTSGSVIYRWTGASAGSEVPAEGSTPAFGNTNGTATVACVVSSSASTALSRIDGTGGSSGECTTAALTNGQAYTYKIFQKDSSGNYDVGVGMGTFTPVAAVSKFNACSGGDTCPTSTARLYTRLAGNSFALYLAALKTDGTVATGFSGNVAVSLLGRIDAGGAVGADNCPTGGVDLTQSLGTLAFASGKRTQTGVTVANAYRDLRVKLVCDATNCPPSGITFCSSDNFAVRPSAFTVSSSANADAVGTSTVATPVVKAGTAFTLTATAQASYNGTPLVDPSKLAAHAGAVQAGSLGGSFDPATAGTGVATGNFTYSEVGYFNFAAQGVYDASFATSSDTSGTDCTDDFNNSYTVTDPTSRVGCKFGNTVTSNYFGRFVPDRFALTAGNLIDRAGINTGSSEAICASSFTYMGEDFKTTFTLTAQNSTPATTQNYTGGHAKFVLTTWSNFGFAGSAGTLVEGGAAPSGTWGSSMGAYGTAAVSATHKITRLAPAAPYTVFSVSAQPTYTDGTATIALAASTATHAGTSEQRFGRLRLLNAYGSELLVLGVPLEAQYWTGSSFARNALDSCTSLTAANVNLLNYQGGLSPTNMGISHVTAVGTLVAGRGSVSLSRPSPASTAMGSMDVILNLGSTGTTVTCPTATPSTPLGSSTSAAQPYLSGNWCGATGYDRDPAARATFGIYKSPLIYRRENY